MSTRNELKSSWSAQMQRTPLLESWGLRRRSGPRWASGRSLELPLRRPTARSSCYQVSMRNRLL